MASPILYKGQRRLALCHRTGASEGPEPRPRELRPYERSRFAEHIRKVEELCYGVLCPPHRG